MRNPVFDYIKGILITLMVLFHLNNFTVSYPLLTNFVYTFHMSGFLILSGYLMNVNKDKTVFKRSITGILVPYLFFEFCYLSGLILLGHSLKTSNLFSGNFWDFIVKIAVQPSGTYWYLHTLLFCMFIYYFFNKLKYNTFIVFLLTGCTLFLLSQWIEGLHFYNILYFLIGAYVRKRQVELQEAIFPTLFSIFPLFLIIYFTEYLNRSTLEGVGVTIFSLSFLMYSYKYLVGKVTSLGCFLGRNSLAIVVFSPIYTIITKLYFSFFAFDPTHILWAIFSLAFILSCCLLSAYIFDKIKLSLLLFLKPIYSPF